MKKAEAFYVFIFDVNENSILLLIFFYFSVTVDEYNVTLVSGVQGIGWSL